MGKDFSDFMNDFKDKEVKEDEIEQIDEAMTLGSNGRNEEYTANKDNSGYMQNMNTFQIIPRPNEKDLPSGLYDIFTDMNGRAYMQKKVVKIDELMTTPDDSVEMILDDLNKFWESKQKYDDYGVTYKRGILMYGEPGTGKTSLINLIIQDIIKNYDGIVINVNYIGTFLAVIKDLRTMEQNRPILAIIEDLDSFLYNNSTQTFLNVLDGNEQIDNVVFLATTNYIDRIEPRIKNRPSRFDRKVEVGLPNDEVRKFYLENKLKPQDLKEQNIDKWVKDTKGMSFSHLKELLVSVVVMGNDYNKTINILKQMNKI